MPNINPRTGRYLIYINGYCTPKIYKWKGKAKKAFKILKDLVEPSTQMTLYHAWMDEDDCPWCIVIDQFIKPMPKGVKA